jgi:hypothetical protein
MKKRVGAIVTTPRATIIMSMKIVALFGDTTNKTLLIFLMAIGLTMHQKKDGLVQYSTGDRKPKAKQKLQEEVLYHTALSQSLSGL